MFLGLIMEPNKRYAQVVEKPFHISQAAIDISTGDNDPCQVMVVVDGKNFLVCTLQKTKSVQVPLDLYFKSGDSIAFLTNGKCNVHLTGYLDPEYEELSEDDAEEEEEEEPAPVAPAKSKRKLENSNDASANKKAKKDKKAKAAADSSDDDDDDEEDQLQKFLDGEDIDTDENDESFKMNTSGEASDSDEEESDEEDEEAEDEEEDDDKSSDEAESTLDTSKEEKVDMSKLSKSQRRRLKKKLQQQGKEQPQVNGVDKAKKEKPEEKQKAEKKKPDAKKDSQDAGDKKEKKTLSGGVFIEDTKVGTGAPAKPGKVVMVYYEGRLKQNNKMFDNCIKGPGFKFKLGAKEVITGWDVGIAGMKVGGKRKIVCPPAMAYGAKGSPPVIPPNSTLVFDVELKNVK
ncbi:46 kDa FK506-binding nuclear protein-like [Ostrinia nubilalis]|uniref:46 kDa FK506-binding nuclear protein-like n=1 Tax=Ostrinia nubilalis TaxID=29057 RepID=UPI0030825B8F